MNTQYINTKCLVLACKSLKIKYSTIDEYGNFLIVHTKKSGDKYFVNSSLAFNTSSIDKICKDKDFSYQMLSDAICMPKSIAFFNPKYNSNYKQYRKFKSVSEILDDIENKLKYPIIIKKNKGAQGDYVFKCKDRKKARYAINKIFERKKIKSDYIALAQEFVNIKKEYRAVFFREKQILLYEKNFINAKIKRNISPLHQENSKAILIKDKKLQNKIEKFGKQVFKKFPIEFVGMDIAIDDKGKLFLIELNTNLGFQYFVRDNGEKPLIDMYKKILREL